MAENNTIYTVLIVIVAILLLNSGLTGNFNYRVSSSYGPTETDSIVSTTDYGKILVVPSFGEKTGDGSIFADAEVCTGDKEFGTNGLGRVSGLTEAEEEAYKVAETACYYECARLGGSISPLFKRQVIPSLYQHTCKRVNVECYCTI